MKMDFCLCDLHPKNRKSQTTHIKNNSQTETEGHSTRPEQQTLKLKTIKNDQRVRNTVTAQRSLRTHTHTVTECDVTA